MPKSQSASRAVSLRGSRQDLWPDPQFLAPGGDARRSSACGGLCLGLHLAFSSACPPVSSSYQATPWSPDLGLTLNPE